LKDKILVNVWVYTGSLEGFFKRTDHGYLYPMEQEFQTQLLIPYEELEFGEESDGICKIK
jgi:hypothetical protein